ncbi:unnamed protein product [Cuscuta campestris]|uniref:Uncharacterized protein n=1 Tax=Cuscuta campestris TaxID=132261 RepID=A0A484L763_9ASTE|nr:unnamed protein product [Cuscuta campestris]
MGNSCSSSSSHILIKSSERLENPPPAAGVAIVVKLDGKAQEFWQPLRAGDVLSENPNCILCSSETLNVGSPVTDLAGDDELQPGQLYFLLPTAKSHAPLSLHDLCALAVKASAALGGRGAGLILDDVRENRRRARPSPGCRVFSAGALVAADAAASFGWIIKLFMVTKRLTSVIFEPKSSSYCVES